MPYVRMAIALSLVGLGIISVANAMQYIKVGHRLISEEEGLILSLKNTSMASLDTSLRVERFEEWFSRHRNNSKIRYEVETCDDTYSRTPYAGKGPLKCVTAVSDEGISSELVLRFVAAAPGKDGKLQWVDCLFLGGSEGPPPGSPIKRMTRGIAKLSDLHWD